MSLGSNDHNFARMNAARASTAVRVLQAIIIAAAVIVVGTCIPEAARKAAHDVSEWQE